ncbi:unnamed protein product [Vitrella brassicaformis CCMP3155]|uniref:NAD(P)-binding domain-containing protein n=1 Tax=Vitrella brassicaformis (strain CCMP3155) TaxID=1169540 RepID=A0A0G4EVK2_VITBC|nr:unnamed protein product [Vitrella brassicaformis CCMP3155]|mmetsp:Transcript_794/g.1740  ORF Transcript_794/g.1740 Transcript_794/m.1740 type:complete len:301 (-) Transcript_794:271-1173(-)|eukprot:CEM02666.1 unnamed protein product [Vitrella brassicaformis CCMP3155]
MPIFWPLSLLSVFVGEAAFLKTPLVMSAQPRKVFVTGAGGKTGGYVFRKLLKRDGFTPVGLVRSQDAAEALKQDGASDENLAMGDIMDKSALEQGMQGCTALIICTSAKPAPSGETDEATGRPIFTFPRGDPVDVDWHGQKNQIDAAKAAGVQHVIICGSMGGTNPSHPLNNLGKKADGSGGNILQWKRKAEKYAIDSGLIYTIVHPGGLIDEAGGKREIIMDIDDALLKLESRTIPREDVAEVLVQSLVCESAKNRSVDIVTKPEGEGAVTTDFEALFKSLSGNCDYTLGVIPEEAVSR